MRLYDFAFSSAAYRVRIALNVKGIPFERSVVSLVKDGGQQHNPAYKALNPQALIPSLEDGGHFFTQSLAIIEYLEETHPEPALLPRDPAARARVRAIAYAIACDIHPINNLRVRQYLASDLKADEAQTSTWYAHWIHKGFGALEAMLAQSPETGRYCHGDRVTLADICLVPQMANAYRFKVPVDAFPTLVRIDRDLRALPAFKAASPEAMGDAT